MKHTTTLLKHFLILVFIATVAISCRKKSGEPVSRICASKNSYLKTDTIVLSNCSDNFTKQRWLLPDGTQSTAPVIYFKPASVGSYKFTLFVTNDDFVYDYESYVYVEVK